MAMAYMPVLLTRARRSVTLRGPLHPGGADLEHAARSRLAHGEEPAPMEEAVARDRDGAGERVQEPAHRLVLAVQREVPARRLVELVHRHVPTDRTGAVGVHLDALGLLRLELVADLAHDLLEHVLQGADAHHPTVLVPHHHP